MLWLLLCLSRSQKVKQREPREWNGSQAREAERRPWTDSSVVLRFWAEVPSQAVNSILKVDFWILCPIKSKTNIQKKKMGVFFALMWSSVTEKLIYTHPKFQGWNWDSWWMDVTIYEGAPMCLLQLKEQVLPWGAYCLRLPPPNSGYKYSVLCM